MKLYKIKKSNIDNRGLVANKDIKVGTRIIEYKGKIISTTIVGYNKNPGIPYPTIQLNVPSKLKILLYAEIKNKAEIKSLPRKSIRLAIQTCTELSNVCQKKMSLN